MGSSRSYPCFDHLFEPTSAQTPPWSFGEDSVYRSCCDLRSSLTLNIWSVTIGVIELWFLLSHCAQVCMKVQARDSRIPPDSDFIRYHALAIGADLLEVEE